MDYIANIFNLPRTLKKSGAWCKRTSTSFIAAVSQALDPNIRTLEMDYIIYIQTSRNEKRELVPKEIGVATLQKPSISHWIVSAPCPFTHLPRDIQSTISYNATHLHGLQYPEGSCTVAHAESYLREIATATARIYVNGSEIAHYVEKVIRRNVIDLANYDYPSFFTLGAKFKNVLVCNQHERRKTFFHFSERCAVYRALLLREWFWSLVPQDWLGKTTIGADLFNSLLHTRIRPPVIPTKFTQHSINYHPSPSPRDRKSRHNLCILLSCTI